MVFVIAFSLRVFWISQKAGLHVDEGLNHIIYSINRVQIVENYPQNIPLSGRFLKTVTYRNDSTVENLFNHLKIIRDFNAGDTGHMSLYSTIYRLWLFGAGDPLDFKTFVFKGCSLNLVFFSFSFLFMFLLLRRLFGESMLVPFGLCAAFLNTGTISNTLFIRPYALQEMAFVLLTLVFVVFFQKIRQNDKIITPKNFFIIALSGALGLLSGYFVLLYIAILAFALFALSLKPIRYKNIVFLLVSFGAAFLLAITFYKGFFLGFDSSRAKDVMAMMNGQFVLQKLFSALVALFTNLISFVFYLPLAIILAIAGMKKYKEKSLQNSKLPLILFVLALLWAFVVLYAAPFRILRYFMASIPIISIIVPYIFQSLREKPFFVLASIYVFVLGLNSIFPLNVESYDSEPISYSASVPFSAHIENLQKQRTAQCSFKKKPEIPLLTFNSVWHKWYY